MKLIKESAPYIRRKADVKRMMLDVVIALSPITIFSCVMYGWSAIYVLLISIAIMLASEAIFVYLVNKPQYDGSKKTFKEKLKEAYSHYTINNLLAPLISALIYALIMPAGSQVWVVIVGALFGIIIGKLLFGGLGSNIFNPAALGRVAASICFKLDHKSSNMIDIVAGGTPLAHTNGNIANITNYKLLDLFIGNVPGAMGEAGKIAIIVGGIYLLIRKSADIRAMLSTIITFAGLMLIAGLKVDSANALNIMLYQLLSGGLIFGAVFMVTDPVTSPTTKFGRILYGSLVASLAVLIRLFGAFPEGVAFAILIMNMFVPAIDYYKWSNPKYNYKQFIVLGAILAVLVGIILLAL